MGVCLCVSVSLFLCVGAGTATLRFFHHLWWPGSLPWCQHSLWPEALSLPADYRVPATFLFGRFIFAKCLIIFYEVRSTEIQGICLLHFLLKQIKECRPIISDLLLPVTPHRIPGSEHWGSDPHQALRPDFCFLESCWQLPPTASASDNLSADSQGLTLLTELIRSRGR